MSSTVTASVDEVIRGFRNPKHGFYRSYIGSIIRNLQGLSVRMLRIGVTNRSYRDFIWFRGAEQNFMVTSSKDWN